MPLRRAPLLALLAILAACARPVSIGTGTGPVYSVEIQNSLSQDMIASYNDGTGTAVLGTVRAGATQSFGITAPTSTSITITARNAAGNRSSGPYTVQLRAGAAPLVVLR